MLNFKPKVSMIALSFVLAACSSGVQAAAPSQDQAPGQTAATATPVPTRVVVANKTVAADGELSLVVPEISQGFEQSGKVKTVNVSLGQTVKKGDVLATIEDTALQDAVTDAQLALDLVEANVKQQNAPATEEEIASAQAALNSAYATYNETKAGNSQTDIDAAQRSLDAAWLQYLSSQSSRDMACGTDRGLEDIGCKSAEASYGNAFESWVSARDNYQKLLEPVTQDTLTQAYSSVASAKAKLEALKAGVSEEQAKIDEVQLNQARTTLESAKDDLNDATLVSLCDCVVQEINIAVGATAGTSGAFKFIDLSRLQFKTTNLTELNIATIKVGASATIRLQPYDDQFTGKVSAVLAQSSGTQSGVALYTVLIDLDATDKKLLPGMTGQAEIAID
ncbi:MAG: HlyD family secretion protein [Chloroflexi bacterium]|nr:HlyD family secretion protein [Chloroflexota bacterium]